MKAVIIDGHIAAEGSPEECAQFVFLLSYMDRKTKEKQIIEQAEKDVEALDKLLHMTFEELMKRERESEE